MRPSRAELTDYIERHDLKGKLERAFNQTIVGLPAKPIRALTTALQNYAEPEESAAAEPVVNDPQAAVKAPPASPAAALASAASLLQCQPVDNDDPATPQTFPACTVQHQQQWRFACCEPQIQSVIQRVCNEGTKRSLLSKATGQNSGDLWTTVKACVDAGDSDTAVYNSLRAKVHPNEAIQAGEISNSPPVPAGDHKAQFKRAEKRVSSCLTLLSMAPSVPGQRQCST